ncbi:MAG: hypothetical protein ABW277_04195 [Longimicrobiaceae bacterium]
MSPVPHPALRRILAAAAMPGRCLESLDAAAPDLAAVARDLEGAALVVDRSLEPLARGIDLAAVLGRAAPPRDRADGRAPGSVTRLGVPRPEEALPPEPPRRSRRVPDSAEPAEARRGPALEHDAAAVAAVLSRFAPAADAGRASRESFAGDAGASGPARRTEPARTSADVATRMPRAVSADTVDGGRADGGGADGGRRFPTREEAAAELRRRTEATAGDAGLDTPVRVGQPAAEVAVLLRDIDAAPEGGRSAAGGRSTADDGRAASAAHPTSAATPGGPTPAIPGDRDAARDDGHLHEVLERVRAVAARRTVAAEGIGRTRPEMDAFGGGDEARGNGADAEAADPPRAPKPAAVAAAGGLRGLAQRAEAAGQVLAPRGVTFPSAAGEPAAGVVAARADEAELAERIDRLLRREARRQGIDLEGVGP